MSNKHLYGFAHLYIMICHEFDLIYFEMSHELWYDIAKRSRVSLLRSKNLFSFSQMIYPDVQCRNGS